MKPSSIRRDIRSRHAHVEGSGPLLGKVPRLHDSDGPRVVQGDRKGSHRPVDGDSTHSAQASGRRKLVLWSGILVAVSAVLLAVFVGYWLKARGVGTRVVAPAGRPVSERIVSKFQSPTEDEALSLVRRALKHSDAGTVGTYFRIGDAAPEEMVEFLGQSIGRDGHLERMEWLGSMDSADILLEGVLVVYEGADGPSERLAFLVPDDLGVWKMDFDAFARISRPSWQDLLDGRAEHARVRVIVAQDSYFNGPFDDERQWLCFAIVSPEASELLPEEQGLLRGYCKVGSPQAQAMERLFDGGDRLSRATLEIHRVAGADRRQFEITRVFAAEWVVAPRALDERFQ